MVTVALFCIRATQQGTNVLERRYETGRKENESIKDRGQRKAMKKLVFFLVFFADFVLP